MAVEKSFDEVATVNRMPVVFVVSFCQDAKAKLVAEAQVVRTVN